MSTSPPTDRDYVRGSTHPDQHVNGLLAHTDTLAEDVTNLTKYVATASNTVRTYLFKNADPQVFLYPDLTTQSFALASFPHYDNDTESVIVSLGRNLCLSSFPVSVDMGIWNGFAAVLLEASTATALGLHSTDEHTLGEANLEAAQISLGDETVAVNVGVLPWVLPLPRGLVVPDSVAFGQGDAIKDRNTRFSSMY